MKKQGSTPPKGGGRKVPSAAERAQRAQDAARLARVVPPAPPNPQREARRAAEAQERARREFLDRAGTNAHARRMRILAQWAEDLALAIETAAAADRGPFETAAEATWRAINAGRDFESLVQCTLHDAIEFAAQRPRTPAERQQLAGWEREHGPEVAAYLGRVSHPATVALREFAAVYPDFAPKLDEALLRGAVDTFGSGEWRWDAFAELLAPLVPRSDPATLKKLIQRHRRGGEGA